LIQHKNNKEDVTEPVDDTAHDEFEESLRILETKRNKTMKLPVRTDVPNELTVPTKSNDVPYSNLKHGNTKPTYSEYKTMTNHVRDLTSDELNEREKRMQLLREKFQRKQKASASTAVKEINASSSVNGSTAVKEINASTVNDSTAINEINASTVNGSTAVKEINASSTVNEVKEIKEPPTNAHTGTMKRIHKETRLYKLGKTKRNTVSILLKDKEHSKEIVEASKELKKHPITDVKQYLRQHNLINATSAATTDVLRKMYESALMTGDVSNTNYSCI
jgi:hypothetical protein